MRNRAKPNERVLCNFAHRQIQYLYTYTRIYIYKDFAHFYSKRVYVGLKLDYLSSYACQKCNPEICSLNNASTNYANDFLALYIYYTNSNFDVWTRIYVFFWCTTRIYVCMRVCVIIGVFRFCICCKPHQTLPGRFSFTNQLALKFGIRVLYLLSLY